MERLRELLAVDHRQALEFFVLGLRDVCEPGVDRQEWLYNLGRHPKPAIYGHLKTGH